MPQWLTRHKWLLIAAAALIVLFAFAACDDDEEEVGETPVADETPVEGETPTVAEPLKIGLLDAFTGDLSDFGVAHENSARLAATEINAAGGVLGQDIEIVTGDTATDPTQGVSEATRLIEIEQVNAIIGALASGVTLAIAESVTGPNSILQISQASTSDALTVANDNDFLFRTTLRDEGQAIVLADLLVEEGITSICNMFFNNAYGQGLSDSLKENFEAAGGTVTAALPHEAEQTTYGSELAQCGDADVIGAISYPESSGVFIREALEAGDITDFFFVDGTKSPAMFDALGWDAFDGMPGTNPGGILELPLGTTFDDAYEAEYGDRPPLPFMREAYDAVYVMALAAEKAGSTDPTAMRDALRGIATSPGQTVSPGTAGYTAALELIEAGEDIDYEGASGPVDFDEAGDVPLGGVEIWRVDAANKDLVTEKTFRVDLTGDVPVVTEES